MALTMRTMEPRRWLGWYDRGMLTAAEVASRLCDSFWDREYDPAEFAAEVPVPILEIVRERVANIPRPEDVLIHGRLGGGALDKRFEQTRYVAWLRKWKASGKIIRFRLRNCRRFCHCSL